MQEYVSEAVVLRKEPVRDFDARYYFFTKRFGKIVGRATSTRKINSKLAGHLEPGNLARVRFVEKNGTRVVDALKEQKLGISLPDLGRLDALLAESGPETDLWDEMLSGRFSWPNALRILGWDPAGAVCEKCGKAAPYFYLPRQEFFCAACASKFKQSELILVAHA